MNGGGSFRAFAPWGHNRQGPDTNIRGVHHDSRLPNPRARGSPLLRPPHHPVPHPNFNRPGLPRFQGRGVDNWPVNNWTGNNGPGNNWPDNNSFNNWVDNTSGNNWVDNNAGNNWVNNNMGVNNSMGVCNWGPRGMGPQAFPWRGGFAPSFNTPPPPPFFRHPGPNPFPVYGFPVPVGNNYMQPPPPPPPMSVEFPANVNREPPNFAKPSNNQKSLQSTQQPQKLDPPKPTPHLGSEEERLQKIMEATDKLKRSLSIFAKKKNTGEAKNEDEAETLEISSEESEHEPRISSRGIPELKHNPPELSLTVSDLRDIGRVDHDHTRVIDVPNFARTSEDCSRSDDDVDKNNDSEKNDGLAGEITESTFGEIDQIQEERIEEDEPEGDTCANSSKELFGTAEKLSAENERLESNGESSEKSIIYEETAKVTIEEKDAVDDQTISASVKQSETNSIQLQESDKVENKMCAILEKISTRADSVKKVVNKEAAISRSKKLTADSNLDVPNASAKNSVIDESNKINSSEMRQESKNLEQNASTKEKKCEVRGKSEQAQKIHAESTQKKDEKVDVKQSEDKSQSESSQENKMTKKKVQENTKLPGFDLKRTPPVSVQETVYTVPPALDPRLSLEERSNILSSSFVRSQEFPIKTNISKYPTSAMSPLVSVPPMNYGVPPSMAPGMPPGVSTTNIPPMCMGKPYNRPPPLLPLPMVPPMILPTDMMVPPLLPSVIPPPLPPPAKTEIPAKTDISMEPELEDMQEAMEFAKQLMDETTFQETDESQIFHMPTFPDLPAIELPPLPPDDSESKKSRKKKVPEDGESRGSVERTEIAQAEKIEDKRSNKEPKKSNEIETAQTEKIEDKRSNREPKKSSDVETLQMEKIDDKRSNREPKKSNETETAQQAEKIEDKRGHKESKKIDETETIQMEKIEDKRSHRDAKKSNETETAQMEKIEDKRSHREAKKSNETETAQMEKIEDKRSHREAKKSNETEIAQMEKIEDKRSHREAKKSNETEAVQAEKVDEKRRIREPKKSNEVESAKIEDKRSNREAKKSNEAESTQIDKIEDKRRNREPKRSNETETPQTDKIEDKRSNREPRKSNETETPESTWKNRIIGKFLKMSKNDIHNILNSASLRKFDIAMKYLVNERRPSLSLEMRKTEEERMKNASYNREEFMDQLSAVLDPSATVEIADLPSQFIHHLSEVLQLDATLEEPLPLVEAQRDVPESRERSKPREVDQERHQSPRKSRERDTRTEARPQTSSHERAGVSRAHERTSVDLRTKLANDQSVREAALKRFRGHGADPQIATKNGNSMGNDKKSLNNLGDTDNVFLAGVDRTRKRTTGDGASTRESRERRRSFDRSEMTTTHADTSERSAHPNNRDSRRRSSSRHSPRTERRSRGKNREETYRGGTRNDSETRYGETSHDLREHESHSSSGGRRDLAAPDGGDTSSVKSRLSEPVDNGRETSSNDEGESDDSSSRSDDGSSTSSSDDSNDEDRGIDVAKLLKVIKKREKMAKKKSLNEEIRDEVAAEIKRRKRAKDSSRKHHKRSRSDQRHHKHNRKERLYDKRHKHSSRNRSDENLSRYSGCEEGEQERGSSRPQAFPMGPLFTEMEIKKEIVIKEEPIWDIQSQRELAKSMASAKSANDSHPISSATSSSLGSIVLAPLVQQQPKTKAQLKQMPAELVQKLTSVPIIEKQMEKSQDSQVQPKQVPELAHQSTSVPIIEKQMVKSPDLPAHLEQMTAELMQKLTSGPLIEKKTDKRRDSPILSSPKIKDLSAELEQMSAELMQKLKSVPTIEKQTEKGQGLPVRDLSENNAKVVSPIPELPTFLDNIEKSTSSSDVTLEPTFPEQDDAPTNDEFSKKSNVKKLDIKAYKERAKQRQQQGKRRLKLSVKNPLIQNPEIPLICNTDNKSNRNEKESHDCQSNEMERKETEHQEKKSEKRCNDSQLESSKKIPKEEKTIEQPPKDSALLIKQEIVTNLSPLKNKEVRIKLKRGRSNTADAVSNSTTVKDLSISTGKFAHIKSEGGKELKLREKLRRERLRSSLDNLVSNPPARPKLKRHKSLSSVCTEPLVTEIAIPKVPSTNFDTRKNSDGDEHSHSTKNLDVAETNHCKEDKKEKQDIDPDETVDSSTTAKGALTSIKSDNFDGTLVLDNNNSSEPKNAETMLNEARNSHFTGSLFEEKLENIEDTENKLEMTDVAETSENTNCPETQEMQTMGDQCEPKTLDNIENFNNTENFDNSRVPSFLEVISDSKNVVDTKETNVEIADCSEERVEDYTLESDEKNENFPVEQPLDVVSSRNELGEELSVWSPEAATTSNEPDPMEYSSDNNLFRGFPAEKILRRDRVLTEAELTEETELDDFENARLIGEPGNLPSVNLEDLPDANVLQVTYSEDEFSESRDEIDTSLPDLLGQSIFSASEIADVSDTVNLPNISTDIQDKIDELSSTAISVSLENSLSVNNFTEHVKTPETVPLLVTEMNLDDEKNISSEAVRELTQDFIEMKQDAAIESAPVSHVLTNEIAACSDHVTEFSESSAGMVTLENNTSIDTSVLLLEKNTMSDLNLEASCEQLSDTCGAMSENFEIEVDKNYGDNNFESIAKEKNQSENNDESADIEKNQSENNGESADIEKNQSQNNLQSAEIEKNQSGHTFTSAEEEKNQFDKNANDADKKTTLSEKNIDNSDRETNKAEKNSEGADKAEIQLEKNFENTNREKSQSERKDDKKSKDVERSQEKRDAESGSKDSRHSKTKEHRTKKKSSHHHNHGSRDKKMTLTEKMVEDAIAANIVKVAPKRTSRESVMARMMEIDVEIHKLMNEKMTLYKMLESGDFTKHDESESTTKTISEPPKIAEENKEISGASSKQLSEKEGVKVEDKKSQASKSKKRKKSPHREKKNYSKERDVEMRDEKKSLEGKTAQSTRTHSIEESRQTTHEDKLVRPLVKESIYSDESLDSLGAGEVAKRNEKKENEIRNKTPTSSKGLALLEESMKSHISQHKKHKSSEKKKLKKRELTSQTTLTPTEVQTGLLNLLNRKKVRKKETSKSATKSSMSEGSHKIWKHVSSVIDAVAKNRVEEHDDSNESTSNAEPSRNETDNTKPGENDETNFEKSIEKRTSSILKESKGVQERESKSRASSEAPTIRSEETSRDKVNKEKREESAVVYPTTEDQDSESLADRSRKSRSVSIECSEGARRNSMEKSNARRSMSRSKYGESNDGREPAEEVDSDEQEFPRSRSRNSRRIRHTGKSPSVGRSKRSNERESEERSSRQETTSLEQSESKSKRARSATGRGRRERAGPPGGRISRPQEQSSKGWRSGKRERSRSSGMSDYEPPAKKSSQVDEHSKKRGKKRRRPEMSYEEMASCSVELIDCKYTYLSPTMHPKILRKLGISKIKPYVPQTVREETPSPPLLNKVAENDTRSEEFDTFERVDISKEYENKTAPRIIDEEEDLEEQQQQQEKEEENDDDDDEDDDDEDDIHDRPSMCLVIKEHTEDDVTDEEDENIQVFKVVEENSQSGTERNQENTEIEFIEGPVENRDEEDVPEKTDQEEEEDDSDPLMAYEVIDEVGEDSEEFSNEPEIVSDDKYVTEKASEREESRKDDENKEDEENEESRTRYTVHKGPILDIKVLGDSFLAASEDGSIYRYSQASNGILNIYKGHEAAVTCIYIHETPEKRWILYSGSLDGTFRCYDITTGAQDRPSNVCSPVQCMDQGWGTIFIGTKSGHISRYSIKSAGLKDENLEFSDKSVLALKVSVEGPRRVLIVASRNQPITIRDANTGLYLRTICGYKNHTVYSLMRDRNLVYCGTSSTSIPVYDFTNGEQVTQYHAGVGIVCMRLYRQILFAGCYDGNIYVFDTKEAKLLCSIPGPGNMLLSMEVVNNEIIAGSKNRQLHSWRMPKEVRALILQRT